LQPHFELRGAAVRFDGRPALQGIDLALARGEKVALVGPSGAGKTTLLRLLGGTLEPDAGTVLVSGRSLAGLTPAERRGLRAGIGFVHQDHALVPILRVAQNVVAGRLGRRSPLAGAAAVLWPHGADLEQVHRILERVGIEEKLFQRTDTLSGGQQQRVAIARALFQEPEALLADEPVASVDRERGRDVLALLVELADERGLTLVASLHDLELARALFPRTVGLRAGRVAYDGATAELRGRAESELFRLEGGRGAL